MDTTEPREQFTQALRIHETNIYVYICSMVFRREDAEDILQETKITLWKKVDEFPKVKNFTAWACGIARIEILRHRQRCQRDRLRFSSQFMETTLNQVVAHKEELDIRQEALTHCLEKLPAPEKNLVTLRYFQKWDIKTIAKTIDRSADTIYKALGRIRKVLFNCIEHTLTKNEDK